MNTTIIYHLFDLGNNRYDRYVKTYTQQNYEVNIPINYGYGVLENYLSVKNETKTVPGRSNDIALIDQLWVNQYDGLNITSIQVFRLKNYYLVVGSSAETNPLQHVVTTTLLLLTKNDCQIIECFKRFQVHSKS